MNVLSHVVSFSDAAAFIGEPPQLVAKWLYHVPEEARYRTFAIAKRSGGQRTINSPTTELMRMQRSLKLGLEPFWRPHSCVHGYRADRTILTNAKTHLKCTWLLNLDLSDSFPSINFPRIFGLFKSSSFGIGPKAAATLAQLAVCADGLPQGSPSSPLISNMICHRLDKQLTKLATNLRCVYTRYADDITFSSQKSEIPLDLVANVTGREVTLGTPLASIISQNGFTVNTRKMWLARRWQSQRVTGLLVNDSLQVRIPQRSLSEIRGALHCVEHKGEIEAERILRARYVKPTNHPAKQSPKIQDVIRGKIEHVRFVYGRGHPIYEDLAHQHWKCFPRTKKPNTMSSQYHYDVFLSHAGQDKATLARPLVAELRRIGVSCWFDEDEIQLGESIPLKINDGLRRSRFVVALITSNSMSKAWPNAEMMAALNSELGSSSTRLIAVVTGGTESTFKDAWPLAAR